MTSVTSLDGNDIFAVARMFEQMNINELGDITETIPPELQIFDQNSSAYSSTNNAWKSWLKEFSSLVGLIDAYAYKSEANSTLVKKLPQTRMGQKQVDSAITTEKARIMKNDSFGKFMKSFKTQVNLLPVNVDFDSQTDGDDFTSSTEQISKFIEEVISDDNISVFFKSILLTEMRILLDDNMSDFSSKLTPATLSVYNTQFREPMLEAIDEKIQLNQVDMNEQVRVGIPEINQLKTTVNETLQSNVSSAIITELSSLKDAIPVINTLNEKLAINMIEWKQLVETGSINLEKSDDSDFDYEIESDTKEMIEILDKYRRDTKVYKDAYKELVRLQGRIYNLLTNQGGIEQVANTVPYVNIDTQKPIRFLATDYDAGDADDDDDDDEDDSEEEDSDVKKYHDSNIELLKKDGLYGDWVKEMKKEGEEDDPYVVGIKVTQADKFLQRIGIDSPEDFKKIRKPKLLEIGRDLNLQFANSIKIDSLRVKIVRRLRVDDEFIDFGD